MAIVLCAMCAVSSAGTFRGGTLGWQIHDLAAPRTAFVTVTTYWDDPTSDSTDVDVDFGDGSTSGPLASQVIYTGVTQAGGEGFTIRRATTTHTYAADGMYTASVSGCCRHATANAAATDSFRLAATVALGTGSYGNPVMGLIDPEIVAGQTAPAFFATPAATWWGAAGGTSGRVATLAESGVQVPAGVMYGAEPGGADMLWDLSAVQPGPSYTLSVVLSDRGGSTAMLDFIVETVPYEPQAPGCSFGNNPEPLGAQPGTTVMRHVDDDYGTATVVEPSDATLTQTDTGDALSWTPAAGGPRYELAEISVAGTTVHQAAECTLPLYVPLSTTACEAGLGLCGANTTCTDTAYGFTCPCQPGYRPSATDPTACESYCDLQYGAGTCVQPDGDPIGMYCCTDPTAPNGLRCSCPSSGNPSGGSGGSGSASTPPSRDGGGGGGCGAAPGAGLLAALAGLLLVLRRRRARA